MNQRITNCSWKLGRSLSRICFVCWLTAWSTGSQAQTLNEATTAQLVAGENFRPCALLLGADDLSVLTPGGQLAAICGRSVGQAGDVSATSGGGFGATPPSAPASVDARLDKDDPVLGELPKRGLFFSVGYDSIDREVTPFEDGYDSDLWRIAGGFDRLLGEKWIVGVAGDWSRQEGDFDDGGDFDVEILGVTVFASVSLADYTALDFYAGYASQQNERERRATFREESGDELFPDVFSVAGVATSDFDADQWFAGIELAHDWTIDNVRFGPRLGYDWKETDLATYGEESDVGLGLTFHDDRETSSQLSVGLNGSVAISTTFGVIVVQESILYRHEFDQDQRDVEVSYVEDTRAKRFVYETEEPDRDFIEFNIAASLILRAGVQLFAEYRGIAAHDFLDSDGVTVGLRKEF